MGAVARAGRFRNEKMNERISVCQAIALSEGLRETAAKGNGPIIRTNERSGGGARARDAIDLGQDPVRGKIPDSHAWEPRDIVFVPDKSGKNCGLHAVNRSRCPKNTRKESLIFSLVA